MIRATLASGMAVTLAVGLVAGPAYSVPSEKPGGSKKTRFLDSDNKRYNFSQRDSNRKVAAKRTGRGSVQGAASLRAKADRLNPNKQVRLVTSYSTDGTIAGFKAPKVRTVRARDVDAVIDQAEADKTAVAVEEDKPVKAIEASSQAIPGGGQYSQWALSKLQAGQVWQHSTGLGVKVAVLDTGVEASHPDLAGHVLAGKDFVANPGNPQADPHGHGTHVAGIVAASMNSIGVTGLAPDAKIIPIRVLNQNGSGYLSAVAAGIREAADRGADIINMSLGGAGTSSPTMETAVDYARSKGVSVLAAMGNDGGPVLSIPAVLPGVVGVGSTTSADGWSSFSNYNAHTDVSAPGSSINSTYKNSGYAGMSGTSMATPYAAASLAITLQAARSVNASATGLGVEQVMLDTAADLGTPGHDHYFGYGRVDPLTATYAASMSGPPPTPKPVTKPVTKPTRKSLKVKVKVGRAASKLRKVRIRANNRVTIRAKLYRSVRGKMRSQGSVSLHKNGKTNLRLRAGVYRITRKADARFSKLSKKFRVR